MTTTDNPELQAAISSGNFAEVDRLTRAVSAVPTTTTPDYSSDLAEVYTKLKTQTNKALTNPELFDPASSKEGTGVNGSTVNAVFKAFIELNQWYQAQDTNSEQELPNLVFKIVENVEN